MAFLCVTDWGVTDVVIEKWPCSKKEGVRGEKRRKKRRKISKSNDIVFYFVTTVGEMNHRLFRKEFRCVAGALTDFFSLCCDSCCFVDLKEPKRDLSPIFFLLSIFSSNLFLSSFFFFFLQCIDSFTSSSSFSSSYNDCSFLFCVCL